MDFFHLATLGTLAPELVAITSPPEGIGLYSHTMARGRRAGDKYPVGAKIFLSLDEPGIKLTSFLGNTENYLIVNKALRDVIAAHTDGVEIEYLTFDLHDHRKRRYSKDYTIVNPIGAFDCLDEPQCGFKRNSDGDLIRIARYVLDGRKVASAPALFRIANAPSEYVLRGDLVAAIEGGGFTNVVYTKLTVSS